MLSIGLCAGSLVLAGQAQAAPAHLINKADLKVAQELRKSAPTGWTSVIIQIKGELSDSRREILKSLKADVYSNFPRIQAAAVRVPNKNLDDLAALPWVTRVSTDASVRKLDDFTIEHTYTDVAWSKHKVDGSGINVAVIDSGIAPRLDFVGLLNNRVVERVSFVGNGGWNSKVTDDCGHGTHVAGIIAGSGGYSALPIAKKTYYGVARSAGLVSVKVLDEEGSGTVSGVLKGLDWAISRKKDLKIRVINMSLGHPVFESYETDPLNLMVREAWEKGIVVVTAAGNYGRRNEAYNKKEDNEGWGTAYGSIQSPANSPWVITVGATKDGGKGRASDKIATYSSRGPSFGDLVMKPDIVAPGNMIVSTVSGNTYLTETYGSFITVPLTEWLNLRLGGLGGLLGFDLPTTEGYARLSGTSMSAPVVSGAVALMLDKDPNLTPDTIKARLMVTADKMVRGDGGGDALTYGAGYLNVNAALASKIVAKKPALSPQLFEQDGKIILNLKALLDENGFIWGMATMADARAVWGNQGVTNFGKLTSGDMNARAVWGLSGDWIGGSRAVWGVMNGDPESRAVWGNGSPVVDLTSRTIFGEK